MNESEGLKAIRIFTKMTIILPSALIPFNHHKLDDGSDKDRVMRRRVMKRGEEEKEPPPAGSVPLKLCPPRPWSTGSRTGSPAAGP